MKERWPSLPYEEWKETYATLHMWTQIVGKIRLAAMPWINHSWHTTLYVTSRGLTTLPMSRRGVTFQIDFDFVAHRLLLENADGEVRSMELRPRSVADFFGELSSHLEGIGVPLEIRAVPNEVPDPIPFAQDRIHTSYDGEYVNRWWRAALEVSRVFHEFRASFIGKCSPVHFFWGAFDLAVTRFSGRRAPEHPGGIPNLPDWVTREAYSHEVSSCGFWPGGDPLPEPVFYAYAYPEPNGFGEAKVRPAAAGYHPELREFLLPYEEVRTASQPDTVLMEFLQSTYEAAAGLGSWDREHLERRKAPGPEKAG